MTPVQLTVVGHAANYFQARKLIDATRLALGDAVPIVIILPEAAISDLTDAQWSETNVALFSRHTQARTVIDSIGTAFVLCLPNTPLTQIVGVPLAISILGEEPEVSEVGGLVRGPNQQIYSGAFRETFTNERGGIALAPIEILNTQWDKQGQCAVTTADVLGGVVVTRREALADHHFHVGSLASRALSQIGSRGNSRRLVFSGLQAFSSEPHLDAFPSSGAVEELSVGSYGRWESGRLWEATLMHRGVALRNDKTKAVTFHCDSRIAAVDGRGEIQPKDTSFYFHKTENQIQLGSGFRVTLSWDDQGNTSNDTLGDFRGSIEGLTDAERTALQILRLLNARLPGPLMTIAKRALSRARGGL